MLLSKKWETLWIYSLGVVVTMIIAGTVVWAQAEYDKNVGCDLARKIDLTLPGLTNTEINARFQGCLATAAASTRWSMPVTIVGVVGTVIFLLGYFIPVAMARIRRNKVEEIPHLEIKLDGEIAHKASKKVSFSPNKKSRKQSR